MPIKGSCHCKATQFEVSEAPASVTRCTCSFCSKRGALWAYYTPRDFRLTTARDRVSTYQWGSYTIQHHYCAICGCGTYTETPDWSTGVADFGNPILLGGNLSVLSTEIFYSVVGAQLDQGRAATLGFVLLALALGAFVLQRKLLGRKSYTAVTGKGDSGLPMPLPTSIRRLCYAIAVPWLVLTIVIYAMALVGGFAETWGRDYSFTLRHYIKAFGIEWTPNGVLWAGAAWVCLLWIAPRLKPN